MKEIIKNYFNPREFTELGEEIFEIEIDVASSSTVRMHQLDNLQMRIQTLSKKYLHSSIKGLAVFAVGGAAYGLNLFSLEETQQMIQTGQVIKYGVERSYLTLGGSALASCGFIHFCFKQRLFYECGEFESQLRKANKYIDRKIDNLS